MANIGDPVRRHTVIPLTEPVTAPEGPLRSNPALPSGPSRGPETTPVKTPEKVPA